MAWHVFHVSQSYSRFQINKQHPEYYRGGAYAFVRVPHVLHPYISTGSKEQPMNRNEEEAQHVGGQRYANEENGEGQTLVFEGVIHGAEEKIEGPQELKAKLQNKICQYD